ncbi:hypothetical protein NKW44_13130 [Acetobacter lovaniensis]|jgi:hypothetical protein|uniref:hypothetical protein n=1 Tax=Acetobacter lovaniensis TaxID=104100 RepID=UPI00209D6040|nr:hypothetical protein [Acetobacter lovaniensis]MCI1698856.1 hypothetical protein [Acetobacter lovaniensis]MCI1796046.1 hypothetical protein [Acetobacter lovaniensis]MCP1240611.1 hypothetical protein [Acetobacter lovaniensis]
MERNDLATEIGKLVLEQLDNEHHANSLNNDILRDHYEACHSETSENIVCDPWQYLAEKHNDLVDEMRVHSSKATLKNELIEEKLADLKAAYEEHILTGDDLLMLIIKHKSPCENRRGVRWPI